MKNVSLLTKTKQTAYSLSVHDSVHNIVFFTKQIGVILMQVQVANIIRDTNADLVLCVTEAGDGFVGIHNPLSSDGTNSYFSISGDTTPEYKVLCCCQGCLRGQLDLKRIVTVVEREIPELKDLLQQISTDVAPKTDHENLAIAISRIAFPLAINLWSKSNGVTGNIITPSTDGIDWHLNARFSDRTQSGQYPFFSESSNTFEVIIAPAEEVA